MLEKVIPEKCDIFVPQKKYDSISAYIECADALSRNMFRPVFIVDMFKKDFFFVSSSFSYLFGDGANEHPITRGIGTSPLSPARI